MMLNRKCNAEQYADFACYCNNNGLKIVSDKDYFYAINTYEELLDGEIIDLRQTPEYQAEMLDRAKNDKIAKNEQKRNVEFIQTTLGLLKTQTPLGDLKIALPLYKEVAKANNGLPAGAVRLYDSDGNVTLSPAISLTEFEALSLEIAMAYLQIDAKSTQYTLLINQAGTIEELEAVEIEY